MTLQVDFVWLVGLLVSFFAACAATGKFLLTQTQRHLDERFQLQEQARAKNHEQLERRLTGIEQANREEAGQWQRIERDMLKRFGELPHMYVMREDYVRGQSVLEAKLDGLADKLEKAQLRGIINGRTS